jgi:uncharacterized membrane protein YfcA
MEDWQSYFLLLVTGTIAGTINIIAGGGSFLTLPLLIFLGFPASVANGTNRVAILLQNTVAIWSFNKEKVLDWRSMRWASLPAGLGAILGSVLTFWIDDAAFERILAVLMVVITLWTLWSPSSISGNLSGDRPRSLVILGFSFFLIGIYGGFIQAGVGFFLLAATSMAGLDLVKGNAVKVLTGQVFTIVSLVIFALQGKVVLEAGLILGAGTMAGGLIGARLTVRKGDAWVRRFVTSTILIFAVLLWVK